MASRVPASWRKSSPRSYNGNCFEVAALGEGDIGIRDSKDHGGQVLSFTSAGWSSFLAAVKDGEFDNVETQYC
jgi:hypothetical protein